MVSSCVLEGHNGLKLSTDAGLTMGAQDTLQAGTSTSNGVPYLKKILLITPSN
jgi:hypothetical protein